MFSMPRGKSTSGFFAISCLLLLVAVASVSAQKVTTVAGGAFKNGASATATALSHPFFAVYDTKGNLYFTDEWNHRLVKVTTSGIISTFAGTGISGYNGDGGKAKLALLSYPVGLAMDGGGDFIVADSGNYRVRKIDSKGSISTIAGNGKFGYSGDGGPATSASFGQIFGITLDAKGNLYLADLTNSVIRMVDTAGIIHTVAGNGVAGFGGDGGPATLANLNQPIAVVTDSSNLYIADLANSRVRKVDASGTITTFAGNGGFGCKGDGGLATSATIGSPRGLMVASGNLLTSTGSCGRVRSVNLNTNIITTIAGSSYGFNGDGQAALSTKFQGPSGLVTDRLGNLVILDTQNQRVREVNAQTQTVSTIAGGNIGDGGPGTSSSLNEPKGVAFDPTGSLYIADSTDNRVRKVSSTGTITTFAGNGFNGYTGDGGPATSATLQSPNAVAADPSGNVFIADQFDGFALRKVDKTGTITTFALSYNFGGSAPFDVLTGLATDSAGNIYGTDYFGCVVWKITPSAAASIVAGVQYSCGYNADGIAATQAWLNLDAYAGVAVDSQGNIYIGDGFNNLVRRVDAKTGLISTVAGTVGNTGCGFSGDGGPAISALLCDPEGVAVDSKGNFFIADLGNIRVRSVNNAGTIQTLAGTGIQGYNGNGLLAKQTNLDFVVALAVKSPGFVYEGDLLQNRVRRIH